MRLLSKSNVGHFAKLIVGFAIYFYLLKNRLINFTFLTPEYFGLLLRLFIIQIIMFLLSTLRWYLIASHIGGVKISFGYAACISWVGQFFSLVLPYTIGTDLNRIFLVHKENRWVKKKTLLYITVADRANAFLAACLCILLGILFYRQQASLILCCSWFVLLVTGVHLIPGKPVSRYLLKNGLQMPPRAALSLSILINILKAISIYLIVLFALKVAHSQHFYVCLASQTIETLRLLPANMGIGHVLFGKALNFINNINGVQVYNIYFTVKVLFSLTGFFGWLLIRN